jgi:hypothetical protein
MLLTYASHRLRSFSSSTYPTPRQLKPVAGLIIRQFAKLTKKPKLDMPCLNFKNGDNSMQRYFHNSETILEQGYKQYLKNGLPFSMFNCMDVSTPMAVLPVKYLGEVRNASTSKLSFASLLNKAHWAPMSRCMVHPLAVRLKIQLG